MTFNARISAIGSYVPEKVLTNDDLAAIVDTNDEWIVQRTGIHERRICRPDEFTSHLCVAAVRDLMDRSGKSVADVDMIIVCTTTPDYPFPSVASQIQHRLGVPHTGAMDLNATCAGFVYGLHIANGLITAGLHRKVLVIGAESLSKITDYTDRSTCILFGDGAGAVLVERTDQEFDKEREAFPCFLAHYAATDGNGGDMVYRSGLSNIMNGSPLIDTQKIVQNGREVYKWVVSNVPKGIRELMSKARLTSDDIDWFIPHSANLRMIEPICERSGLSSDKTLLSLAYYGNTSSATIPLALDLGIREGKVKPGHIALLYGFGGGLVQAGLLLRV